MNGRDKRQERRWRRRAEKEPPVVERLNMPCGVCLHALTATCPSVGLACERLTWPGMPTEGGGSDGA